jgi:chemotaxis protein methyltransferase CheR
MMQASESTREFAFSKPDFEKVRSLIYRHAGIALGESKQNMVYSRLAQRLRALKLESFGAYLALIEHGRGKEWQCFVNSLTTNLTYFFREPHHFTLLAELLSSLREQSEIRLWCAAASTGEEPYSLAITAVEALGQQAARVRILATDIDTSVLEFARQAVYSMESVNRMDEAMVRRHFVPAGLTFRVRPELQALVSFRQINLLDAKWPLSEPFDAIFCRNVLIYFDRATQTRVVTTFVPLLRPHGRLFIGHSESLAHLRDLFRLEGRTVYRPARDLAPPP